MINKSIIEKYYSDMNLNPVYARTVFGLTAAFKKDTVILSDSRYVRAIASRLMGKDTAIPSKVQEKSKLYLAMKDALLLLAKKNVPVYFYNRIGLEKTGFDYSDSAKNRMKKHISYT